MKHLIHLFCMTFTAFISIHTYAFNQAHAETLAATLYKDCSIDLEKYCASITPGDGRKVACLIAHSDKVSPRCRLTSFLMGKQLARTMNHLEKLHFTCSSDIHSLCDGVIPGGTRIYKCLVENKARLLDRCATALPAFESEYLR